VKTEENSEKRGEKMRELMANSLSFLRKSDKGICLSSG
jgi:hypothetical protein